MLKSFRSATSGAAKAKIAIAGAAVGAGLALKELYDIGSEFDDAFDTIRVGTGKTGKQLDRLKGDFKNVVASVPTDFAPASEAIAELNTRLGLMGKPLRQRSKQFLELSRITDSDVATDIQTVTRAFGDWEVATGKQGQQLDFFFRASQASGSSVSELADQVVKFGAPLRQVGFTLNEATAMFASFEKAGVNTQTMMPGLKMAMKTFFEEDVDPKEGIRKTFKGIEDGTIKTSEALKIFGSRAGGDMVEAVNQGRFHLGKFTREISKGDDTIRKAGKETMDFSEKAKILGNKLKVFLEPAATAVFEAVGHGADIVGNFVTGMERGTGAGGQFADVMRSIGVVVIPFATSIGEITGDLAQFTLGILSSKAGIVILSSVVGALLGRMVALGAVWAVGKVIAFVTAIGGVVNMVRTAIQITTSLRAAMVLLTAQMGGVRAAMLSSGIGIIAVVAGAAIGGLMGMSAATSQAATTADQLNQSLHTQAEAMREVNDIDLDVAQRKANLVAASNSVIRAQQRVNQLAAAGKKGSLSYKEAVNALAQAKISEKRASRELNRTEDDSAAKRRKLAEATRESIRTGRERLKTLGGELKDIAVSIRMDGESDAKKRKLIETQIRFGRTVQAITAAELKLKNEQLDNAKATGASQGKVKSLKDEIERLRGKSEKASGVIRGFRENLNKLPGHKKIKVDVEINVPGLSGPVGGGGKGSTGSGWPLSQHIDSKVRGKVQDFASAHPMEVLGASMGLGGAGASSVDAFTPLASRYGLSMTSGYRPGDDGYHGINRARDYSNASGPTPEMMSFARFMATVFGSTLKELIYTPLGFSIKDGQRVPPYAAAEHYNHVHVAMQQGGFVVPGQGSGDKVPISIMAEPRERIFVLNRNASDALGSLSSLNSALPRFQGGGVVGAFAGAVRSTKAPYSAALALFAAGIVESGLKNLDYGDGTSTGALQVLASTAQSMGIDPMNPGQVARAFLTKGFTDGVGAIAKAKSGMSPGDIAQAVQGSAHPERYGAVLGQARAALLKAGLQFDGETFKGSGGSGELTQEQKEKRKVKKGRTGKGGGTEGPWGKKRKNEKSPHEVISLPGLQKGTVPKSLKGLPSGITGLFTSPGMTRSQRDEAADLALQVAGTTASTEDDRAVLGFQKGAASRRKKTIQKQIRNIDKELSKRMTNIRRKKLMEKRAALTSELSDQQGRIISAREGLRGLEEGGEEEGEGNKALEEAIQKQTEAIEAETQSREALVAAQKELTEELMRNRKIAESELATAGEVARRALADIIAGQLGARSNHRSNTAGAGSVVSS